MVYFYEEILKILIFLPRSKDKEWGIKFYRIVLCKCNFVLCSILPEFNRPQKIHQYSDVREHVGPVDQLKCAINICNSLVLFVKTHGNTSLPSIPLLPPFYYSSSSLLLYCFQIPSLSLYSLPLHLPSLSFNLSSPTPFSNSSPFPPSYSFCYCPFSSSSFYLSLSPLFSSPISHSFLLYPIHSLVSPTYFPSAFLFLFRFSSSPLPSFYYPPHPCLLIYLVFSISFSPSSLCHLALHSLYPCSLPLYIHKHQIVYH